MKYAENINILIVEDDEEARETLLEILDKTELSNSPAHHDDRARHCRNSY